MRKFLLPLPAIAAALISAMLAGEIPVGQAQGGTNIDVGDFYFCSPSFQDGVCETQVSTGTTVTWSVSSGTHTVTQCDDSFTTCPPSGGFDSGDLSAGASFTQVFNQAGAFEYRCNFHPTQMRGRVVVSAAQATPTPAPTPGATATPAPGAPAPAASPTAAAVPRTGGDPRESGPDAWLIALVGGLLLSIAALAGLRTIRHI